ncbi:hypothetical protein FA10DRAFT_258722 [Acaromyces ingoldii]|uniref:Uncharacterized protein n=1 Tax=Acaromyces ingoldii TaxID=215250 RepID=A0A316YUC4_9BASI|nr:hypothetical protein FA10DRAFT_258722 [Acaromyces ingoldii]PWN91315.1 hypothetical protein FA10DRAFT_258722 [Acaromyces ingoldii]
MLRGWELLLLLLLVAAVGRNAASGSGSGRIGRNRPVDGPPLIDLNMPYDPQEADTAVQDNAEAQMLQQQMMQQQIKKEASNQQSRWGTICKLNPIHFKGKNEVITTGHIQAMITLHNLKMF